MAHLNIKQVYGIRGCALLSLLSSFMMIALSIYVFVTRLEELTTYKFPNSKVPNEIKNADDNKDYQEILTQMNTLWAKNRPVLVSSSMLAILAGLLQAIFCALVILADSKGIQIYIRKWVTVHFILIFVLFIILLNTIVICEKSTDKESWKGLTSNLKKYLNRERPQNDYTELFRFLGAAPNWIYIGAITNLSTILLLLGATLYIMKSHQQGDYESYE